MTQRTIEYAYEDPLDVIWVQAAAVLGIQVARSKHCYASWDGQGTLTLADSRDFDADDSLAQLVFHELCHALVTGPLGRNQVDWGLDNTSERDLQQEYATHRVQAALSEPYGLREFFAVTTDWRPHWDALPKNPLHASSAEQALAVELAEAALVRANREPWKSALFDALKATAQIANVVSRSAPQGSLWSRAKAIHPSGFPLGQVSKTCADCAWGRRDAVKSTFTCLQQQHSGAQPLASSEFSDKTPACDRFEAPLGPEQCRTCGACCREGFHEVEVAVDEPLALIEATAIVRRGAVSVLPRPQGRCVYLSDAGGRYTCDEYARRPRSCADFPVAGEACLIARRRVGLSR